ncbi:MAG TPA: M23 family metallopeptidase [Longimicrobiales bacterium]|nr:M23 family metallopeptidase [Longimicrobiales bacterium]
MLAPGAVALAALLACWPLAAPAAAQPVPAAAGHPSASVAWLPERPGEGEIFVVRVEPPADEDDPVALIAGRAGQEPLHFVRGDDGAFESLAAVPLGRQDTLPIELTIVHASGREEVVRREAPVSPGVYEHRRLTVDPELGSPPDSAQRARRERETRRAMEVSAAAHRTPRMWSLPIRMPREGRVTSTFGQGRIFNGQVSSRHTGLDLQGQTGDTVVAAARGIVALADTFELAGRMVYINHGGGLVTAYFHLSEQLVAEGDTVEAGQPIGRVGATGRVTGPHLHWVVRYGETSVDPRSLLALSASHEGEPD